jgi:uncharacterized protein YjbJ (UPF0337 family)
MDEDRFAGSARQLGGQIQEGVGSATGDVKSQLEGKLKQAEGALQDAYGKVKDTATRSGETIRERAGEAEDFLRHTIEQRPYTTALFALGIGFLLGLLAHRERYD